MVTTTKRDDGTWYQCEKCGLLLEDKTEAEQHEEACDAEEPSYLH